MTFSETAFREISAEVGFSGFPLDRHSDKRDDGAFVDSLRADPKARALVIARDMPVLKAQGDRLSPYFNLVEAAALGPAREDVLLGTGVDGPVFAILLDDTASRVEDMPAQAGFTDRRLIKIPGRDDLQIKDLRSLALRSAFDRPTNAMLAGAKSLLYWHARHRFCSCCGAPSVMSAAGWRRECMSCRAQHFPRTDPVVIMLAIDGDKCLLGRQPRFPKGMYSALAGFLEPGETIEEAVRREIKEEAGINCGEVKFIASQPWPFPSSLMIGCIAKAISKKITVDKMELEDARWFTRKEALTMLSGDNLDGLNAPQPLAIAYHLLRTWARDQ